MPDATWGEAVQAVVVPADGSEPSAQELISFARARLAHCKCPASIRLVDALPRNASGKVLKRSLRTSAGDRGRKPLSSRRLPGLLQPR